MNGHSQGAVRSDAEPAEASNHEGLAYILGMRVFVWTIIAYIISGHMPPERHPIRVRVLDP
jgi:hypothetical protein